MTPQPWKIIHVESGFGANTRQPFVEIKDDRIKEGEKIQLSPEEARDLALNLIEAAEAAEQDAFIFDFGKESTQGDDKGGAALVHMYREWRMKHGMGK